MEEKRYLKWYNMVGYGTGDIAGNVVYAFLSSFVMIYLTNTVGLNAGIVGTLIAVSKLFDGITDVFFGAMIDKTKPERCYAESDVPLHCLVYSLCRQVLERQHSMHGFSSLTLCSTQYSIQQITLLILH